MDTKSKILIFIFFLFVMYAVSTLFYKDLVLKDIRIERKEAQ